MSIQLKQFDAWVRSILAIDEMAGADSSQNGVQVERRNTEIARAAFAVDACMETFERAVDEGADILFVHHGLFWNREQVLTGAHYRRLAYLIEHDLALYAVHLPLDAHPEVGNNASMARALGLENREPFGTYHGIKIGTKGILPRPASVDEIVAKLFGERENTVSILPFGKPLVRRVGIVSGGAPHEVEQAIDEGLEIYITGDADHTIYHRCMEAGIHVLSGGHYATETWGPRAMMERFVRDTGLEAVFVDVPTGL